MGRLVKLVVPVEQCLWLVPLAGQLIQPVPMLVVLAVQRL